MDRTRASAAAVGRELGLSDVAVLKAAAAGRISRNADGSFDIDKAKLEYANNTNPVRGGKRGTAANAPAASAFDAPSQRAYAQDSATNVSLLKARTMREAYEAKSAKLKYEEQAGALINRKGAEIAIETCIRILRDAAVNAVDRTDLPHGVRAKVREATRRAIADALKSAPAVGGGVREVEQAA